MLRFRFTVPIDPGETNAESENRTAETSAGPLAQSLQKLNRVEECRQVSDQGIEVSTKNGDAMVTKNLEALKSALPA